MSEATSTVAPSPRAASASEPGPPTSASLELLLETGPVPLGFVTQGESTYLVARERSARWPVQVLREGQARLRVAGALSVGRVRLLTDAPEKERVLRLFLAKYGAERYGRWYDRPARVLEVRSGDGSQPSPSDHYYGWLAAEFDNVAEEYDHHITGNRMNRLLRDRSMARLRERFASSPVLLEIGCGSGMETLQMLEEGHEMVCVDISERMLETVRAKARRAGVSERLRTRQLTASSLATLLGELGPGAVDGGYSTYGALNCEEDLRSIPPNLHALIRPGGGFVAGVYNRWCLFEIAGYGLTGQWSRASGRTQRPIPVGSSRFCVDVFAHSTGDFERLFAPWFSVERIEGVPVVLPPSDLVAYSEKFSRHFDTLARWDARLGRFGPFRHLGDHFLMTLVRTQ